MSDETNKNQHEGDTLVPDAAEIMGAGEAAESAEPTSTAGEYEAALAEARAEAEELRNQMLRAVAEAENVRRRAQRDVSDARQYAVTSFARDLLNVADNFARAMDTLKDADLETLPPEVKSVVEGIQMTERELKSVFERHGIKTIDPTGQKFDPNQHQAMFEVENPDIASGTVVQTVQLGSMIGERVLRPAMVGVSKGGPKPGQVKPEAGEDSAEATGDAA
ncbi:nucleotide exchange factor GrpE [Acuticoccus sp. I52.16.1]|uniref:nucleotide exchange factor GrpE n=1 Tax=Acuticoccus sp. I52.16.1 TaxID=2928472 RepID=UPI001FD1A699|nr:nucleotide exchange factor GrpE [Acuticoccus sp. I52.16.1]UOM35947.1 nucleotide exchange factor GrpE [Acuticoccus sp. I52.16.1]